MKLVVPDIIVPATGEKTLRQYKCAKATNEATNVVADITIAVTNRRIIQHIEENSSGKTSDMIHKELFIENVGGISLFRGKTFNKKSFGIKAFIFFLIFGGAAGVAFWQSQSIYDFVIKYYAAAAYDTLFKAALIAVPALIYFIFLLIFAHHDRHYSFNIAIMSKGIDESNIKIEGNTVDEERGKCIVVPYLKETQKMFSEIGSIILDVLRYGPDEVLKHIDSEESVKE